MEPLPKDRKDPWKSAGWAALVGSLAYGASLLLSLMPGLAESLLGDGRSTVPTRVLSTVSRHVPFSIAEVAIGAYVLWIGFLVISATRSILKGERRVANAFRGGVRRTVRDGGFATALFFVIWGFNYSRPPLAERAGWPEWSEPSAQELSALAQVAVSSANEKYETLNGTADLGSPTPLPSELEGLESAVRIGSELALPFLPPGQTGDLGMPVTRIKRPFTTGLVARLGVSGVFVPFTGEPHVVRGLPAASAVQTFAHERAHSWGFANEAEASYAGYLANALAPDPLANYAAALFAANQLLRALRSVDRSGATELRDELSAGIRRDLDAINDFWRPYAGFGQRLGSAMNDRYLRVNRVAGGVDSYRRSSRLLVEFARQNDGLVPELAESSQ